MSRAHPSSLTKKDEAQSKEKKEMEEMESMTPDEVGRPCLIRMADGFLGTPRLGD